MTTFLLYHVCGEDEVISALQVQSLGYRGVQTGNGSGLKLFSPKVDRSMQMSSVFISDPRRFGNELRLISSHSFCVPVVVKL